MTLIFKVTVIAIMVFTVEVVFCLMQEPIRNFWRILQQKCKNRTFPWMWLQNIFGTRIRSTSKYQDTLEILLLTSIKLTSVNFNIQEKQGQLDSGIAQQQYYYVDQSFILQTPFYLLFFSFRQNVFDRYVITNITIVLANVWPGSILRSTVAPVIANKSENLCSQSVQNVDVIL